MLSNAGIVLRAAYYGIIFLVIICLMMITPGREGVIAAVGRHTLPVYALHIPLLRIIDRTGWVGGSIRAGGRWGGVLIAAAWTAAIILVTGRKQIDCFLRRVLRPAASSGRA